MTRKRKRQQAGAIEKRPMCVVPVSDKMFQAEIPPPILTGNSQDPDSSKWLGTKVWPPQESSNDPTQDDKELVVIGKGRESCCTCQSPGSVECVNVHVAEERNRLKTELGPAFEEWGFRHFEEGGGLGGWSKRDENKFDEMMERKPGSRKVKLELLHQYFRNRDGKSIVNYFYNVYCPRKFARKTRAAGSKEVDTDNDDDEEEEDDDDDEEKDKYPSNSQTSEKGIKSDDETAADNRSKSISESSSKKKAFSPKNKYMAGFR